MGYIILQQSGVRYSGSVQKDLLKGYGSTKTILVRFLPGGRKVAGKKTESTDRGTQYALDVLNGKILAGPYVRQACQRHLNDLEHGHERGLYYDVETAEKRVAFFEKCLCLSGGKYEGKPFILLPWQAFIISSVMGWKIKSTGLRRFRVAYIETARGSGKTPLAAGVGFIGLVADNCPRAEIYALANTREQAGALFRDSLVMFDHSIELQSRLTVSGGTGDKRNNIAYLEKGSFFRIVSADGSKKAGSRPHYALFDELHEAPNGDLIEMMRSGFKNDPQPLSFLITNSGSNVQSVCYEYHIMGRKIADGTTENDSFFAYVCALDDEDIKDDRYLHDESCWSKSNPSIDYGLPTFESIRAQVMEAEGLPSKMAKVKRLHYNIWTEADSPWISKEVWNACRDDQFDESLLINRPCVAGLDLSSTQDLTGVVLLFDPTPADPFYRLKCHFWLPGDNLQRKADQDKVPYLDWRDKLWLETFDGGAVNKSAVVKRLHEISLKYNLRGVAYDRAMINDLFAFAEKAGIDLALGSWNKERREWEFDSSYGIKMMPFGQDSRSMSPALSKFEGFLINKEVRHDGNPILTWCAANAVVKEDEDGYRKVSKRKSTGRVDGIICSIQAAGVCECQDVISVFEQRLAEGKPVLRSF